MAPTFIPMVQPSFQPMLQISTPPQPAPQAIPQPAPQTIQTMTQGGIGIININTSNMAEASALLSELIQSHSTHTVPGVADNFPPPYCKPSAPPEELMSQEGTTF